MALMGDPVITGYGVFTAFGFGEQALLDGVFAGQPGFRQITRFDVTGFLTRHAAMYEGADIGPPRQSSVLRVCAEHALRMSGIAIPSAEMPVLVGTKGDFTGISESWRDSADDKTVAQSLAGGVAHDVGEALGLGGIRIAFTNACIGSANAIAYGAQLVRARKAAAVLCGGTYLVDREVFAKFETIRAFASDGQVHPFCARRSGLLLGDGAAALVIEDAARARARNAEPLARIAGWGMSGDAYHVIRPDPEGKGMALAIERGLRRAGWEPGDVDYLNAHGTGTAANDLADTRSVHRAFGQHASRLPVSSAKGAIGHSLESAAAIQAIVAVLALRHGMLPPTAGYSEPDPDCDLDYVPNKPRPAKVRKVVTTSAGFGGVNAALLLERM